MPVTQCVCGGYSKRIDAGLLDTQSVCSGYSKRIDEAIFDLSTTYAKRKPSYITKGL